MLGAVEKSSTRQSALALLGRDNVAAVERIVFATAEEIAHLKPLVSFVDKRN